jgi:arginase
LLGAGPPALVALVPRRLAPTQIVLAGARDLDRDEALFVSDAAISLLGPADLLVPDRVAGRIHAGGFTRVYVHLDLDVIDPAEFPDSLIHAADGVSIDVVTDTVRHLASAHSRLEVVGFSVVEFRPRSGDAVARAGHLLDRCGVDIGVLSRKTRPGVVFRSPES